MRIFILLMLLGAVAYAPVYWAATPALRRYIGIPFVLSFVVLTFGGLFAPPGLFFFLLCPLVMVALTVSRLDAICRFILLGALVPNPSWPLIVGGTYIIQVGMMDMLAVGLALAMFKPDHPRVAKIRGFTIEDLIVILFFIALFVASIRLVDGLNGLLRQMLSGVLQLALPYFLLRRHIRNLTEFRIVMGSVAAACAILSIYAIYEAANGWSMFGTIYAHLGQDKAGLRNVMMRGGSLRASAAMGGPLMLGCYLSIGWVAILCSRDFVRSKTIWIASCALIFVGELAAQSRGNLLCVASAVPILLIANRRTGLAVVMSAVVAVAGGALYLAASFSERIAGFLNISPDRAVGEDYDYRQVLFRRGMEEAAKHRWTGLDMNSIVAQLGDIRQGEGIVDFVNTYLYLYLVSGLLFLMMIILAIATVSYKMFALPIRKASPSLISVRGFAMAAWASTLIMLSFMSFIDRIPILFVIALIASRTCRMPERNIRSANPALAK